MCACEWNYICDKCRNTPADPQYLLRDDDPGPFERDRVSEAEFNRHIAESDRYIAEWRAS